MDKSLTCKYALVILLLVSFVFNSGLVFELTQVADIKTFTVPYSIGLSNKRLDIGGYYSHSDIEMAQTLYELQYRPIYADIHGVLLLQELYGNDFASIITIQPTTIIPDDAYIFLRTYNQQNKGLIFWRGAGLREFILYEELNFNEQLKGRLAINISEHAVVYCGR